MPLTSAALSVGQWSAIPYKLANALRDVCSCRSVWGEVWTRHQNATCIRGHHRNDTSDDESESEEEPGTNPLQALQEAPTGKGRAAAFCRVRTGQRPDAARLYAHRRNTNGGQHTLDMRTIIILSGNYQLLRSVDRPNALRSDKR